MVRFYGNGIVWDAERNRMLCEFSQGTFETDNERAIEILQSLGYDSEILDEPKKRGRPKKEADK